MKRNLIVLMTAAVLIIALLGTILKPADAIREDTRKVYGYATIKKKIKGDFTVIDKVEVAADDGGFRATARRYTRGLERIKWQIEVPVSKDERSFTATAFRSNGQQQSISFKCKKAVLGDPYHAKPDIVFDDKK